MSIRLQVHDKVAGGHVAVRAGGCSQLCAEQLHHAKHAVPDIQAGPSCNQDKSNPSHPRSSFDQLFGRIVWFPNNVSLIQVPMVAIQEDRHVYINDVTLLKGPFVRYAMADDLQGQDKLRMLELQVEGRTRLHSS